METPVTDARWEVTFFPSPPTSQIISPNPLMIPPHVPVAELVSGQPVRGTWGLSTAEEGWSCSPSSKLGNPRKEQGKEWDQLQPLPHSDMNLSALGVKHGVSEWEGDIWEGSGRFLSPVSLRTHGNL